MAEEYNHKSQEEMNTTTPVEVETQNRGWFDFLGRKKEEEVLVEEKKPDHHGGHVEEEVIVSEFEEKPGEEEKKHHSLLEQMHRSDGNSSFSSVEEDEEKRKTKKEKEEKKNEDTSVPVEKLEVEGLIPTPAPEEKKGFMERVKEKLPSQHKKAEEHVVAPPPVKYEAPFAEVPPPPYQDDEAEEKKGIMEKLPGQHNKAGDHVVDHPPPVKYEAPFAEVPPPPFQDDEAEEKKGIMEKVKEKLPGQHNKAGDHVVDHPPPVKYEAPFAEVPPPPFQDDEAEEKKGIMEKVKEKLPGQHNKAGDHVVDHPPPVKYEAPFAEVPPPSFRDSEAEEKKGIMEKVKEKLPGQHNKAGDHAVDHPPPVKYEAPFASVPPPLYQDGEKKDILEKMKEKLPGQHKKAEDRVVAPPPPVKYESPFAEVPPPSYQDSEAEEKKGIMEKVKEKLPGQHNKAEYQVVAPPPPVKYEAPFAEVSTPSYQHSEAEEKRGIMEEVKEKLPGQHNKAEDQVIDHPPSVKHEAPFAEVQPPLYQDDEKKDILEKMKEQFPGQHNKAEDQEAYPSPPPPVKYEAPFVEVPPPQCQDGEVEGLIPTPEPEEKKGFLEKIKDKLPGHHKKADDQVASPPPPSSAEYEAPPMEVPPPQYQDGGAKEKKGIMKKIKEKLPGHHPKAEEDNEKDKY